MNPSQIDTPLLQWIKTHAKNRSFSVIFRYENRHAAFAMRQKHAGASRNKSTRRLGNASERKHNRSFSYCKNRRPAFAMHRKDRKINIFHRETNRPAALAMRQKGSNIDLFSYCKNRRPLLRCIEEIVQIMIFIKKQIDTPPWQCVRKEATSSVFLIVKIDAPPLRCIEKITKSIF